MMTYICFHAIHKGIGYLKANNHHGEIYIYSHSKKKMSGQRKFCLDMGKLGIHIKDFFPEIHDHNVYSNYNFEKKQRVLCV
jgi:hypothetical protein